MEALEIEVNLLANTVGYTEGYIIHYNVYIKANQRRIKEN